MTDTATARAGVQAFLDAVASYRASLPDPRLGPGDVIGEQLPTAIVTSTDTPQRTVPLRESHLRALLGATELVSETPPDTQPDRR